MITESLINYSLNPALGRNLKGVFLVKGFSQVETFRRALDFKGNTSSLGDSVIGGKTGRDYANGLVFTASFDVEEINLSKVEWSHETMESTGLDFYGTKIILANGNLLEVIDNALRTRTLYDYPWFGHLHAVSFSHDGKQVLVASSGFDTLFEIDLNSGCVIWEWNCWENGYNQSLLGHYLTRDRDFYIRIRGVSNAGVKVLFVEDPLKYAPFGIPTAQRACHINGAAYYYGDKILSTLFHQGIGIVIDRKKGTVDQVIEDTRTIHGFLPDKNYGFIFTDTIRGRFGFLDKNFNPVSGVSLADLYKPEHLKPLGEWLQFVSNIDGSVYAAVDILRSSIFLINVEDKTYRQIRIPPSWALQMVLPIPDNFYFIDVSQFSLKNVELKVAFC